MKVLVVGGGGREHALGWALLKSPDVQTLRCAPGNAGTTGRIERVDLAADDLEGLTTHAVGEGYDLVVIGPEAPLVGGLADRLRQAGLSVFGPSAVAAEIEGSKVFAKEFMSRHGIPSADFRVFEDPVEARSHLDNADYPLVIKADGLAAGKGVVIAQDPDRALRAAEGMLSGRDFGPAGRRIVVEELLKGREASFFVLSDGEHFVELATCQDYKRAHDGDLGPNTGGMGCYSPSVYLGESSRRALLERIIRPTIAGLKKEGRPYMGVLYVGLMLTKDGPKVLEYNARFGDPETQVLMPRLDGDWLTLLYGCARGDLGTIEPRWRPEAAVCVVMACAGYPGRHASGVSIRGIEDAEADDVMVFHGGTKFSGEGDVTTSGGRVLGVTALGADVAAARLRAYEAVDRIRWEGERHRMDIARDAVETLREVQG